MKAAEEEFVRNSCPREPNVDRNVAFSRNSSRGGQRSADLDWRNINLEENELNVRFVSVHAIEKSNILV